MSNHQREMAFLRRCLLHDDTAERNTLEASITQLERNERCVQRAVWLMVLLAALAVAGLGYCTVFSVDYPDNMSRISAQFTSKLFCALGLGSLICLLAFVGLWASCRKELDERRDDCRRLAAKILESRLPEPGTMPLPGTANNRENVVNGGEAAVPASEMVKLPKALIEASRSPRCRPRRPDGGGEVEAFQERVVGNGNQAAKSTEAESTN